MTTPAQTPAAKGSTTTQKEAKTKVPDSGSQGSTTDQNKSKQQSAIKAENSTAGIIGKAIATAVPQTTAEKWLQTNDAPAEAVAEFTARGYRDVEDLTPEVLRTVLVAKQVQQGIIDRLIRIRTQQLAKKELRPLPELKPGTVHEMSAPTLKGVDNISMKLPDLGFGTGATETSAVVSAADLTPAQWITLAKNSDMLSGTNLAALYEGRSSVPEESFSAALDWVVPADDSFFNCKHLTSRINTEITYTAHQASMIAAGFTSVDASAQTPFVSGKLSVETSNEKGDAQGSTHLYIVGTYDFDRVRVDLDKCTRVSPRFVDAVEEALHEADQKAALARVFEKYGQVIGREITLGGRLYFIHAKDTSEVAHKESAKVSVSAAISGAFANFGGSVGFGVEQNSASNVSDQAMRESISFRAIGGDVTLVNEPEKWKDTIKAPALWEVIRYDKLQYTYDLLPKDLREVVVDIWNGPDYLDQKPFIMPGLKVETVLSDGTAVQANNREFAGAAQGSPLSVAAFGVRFDRKTSGLSVRYWGRFAGHSEPTQWYADGKQCSLDNAPLEEFMLELTEQRAKRCDLHYRARLRGRGLTDWAKAGERCGAKGEIIEGIEIILSEAGAGTICIPANSFIPAESKHYTNNSTYGPGVIFSDGGECVLTYRIYYGGTRAVRRRLDMVFAAREHRPIRAEFNQKIVADNVPDFTTGGWYPDTQQTFRLGVVALQPGNNVLKIYRTGASPHFQEFRLVAEVVDIPAMSYNRLHSKTLGTGNHGTGVIYGDGAPPYVSVYDFNFPGKRPTILNLESVYAVDEHRPVCIRLNTDVINEAALTTKTGGYYPDKFGTEFVAQVEVSPGPNRLSFSRDQQWTPHILEFRFVPAQPFCDLCFDE